MPRNVTPRPPRILISYAPLNAVARRVEIPFVVGVIADLGSTTKPDLENGTPDLQFIKVRHDSLDDFMKAISPRLALEVPDELNGSGNLSLEVAFHSLDAFTPDQLIKSVPTLREYFETHFASRKTPSTNRGGESAAHEKGESRDSIQSKLSRQLEHILHHPEFLRLEGAWRGLAQLIHRNGPDRAVSVWVLNIRQRALENLLRSTPDSDLFENPLLLQLRAGVPSTDQTLPDPFSLLLVDFAFDHQSRDVAVLKALSRFGAFLNAPCITNAAASLFHLKSWRGIQEVRDLVENQSMPEFAAWNALRESSDACYLALTMPRYLARPTYKRNSSKGSFRYEEAVGPDSIDSCSWGHSAWMLAATITRSFRETGGFDAFLGVKSGGQIPDLAGLSSDMALRAGTSVSTEVAIVARREAELCYLGLLPFHGSMREPGGYFLGCNSLGRPVLFDDAEASVEDYCLTLLSNRLFGCRWVHYLRRIGQEHMMAHPSTEDLRARLQEWLDAYVCPNQTPIPLQVRIMKPLQAARVDLLAVPGLPGALELEIRLRSSPGAGTDVALVFRERLA
jgi:type VI secretion system protein ImpC